LAAAKPSVKLKIAIDKRKGITRWRQYKKTAETLVKLVKRRSRVWTKAG
jgi:hypothetical protein